MTTEGASGLGAPPAAEIIESDRLQERLRTFAAAAIPLLLTAAAYLPSLRNGFAYDDVAMVVNNKYIGQWSFVWRSFTHDVWWFRDPLRLPQSLYYRPLEDAWLALNFHLFGLHPLGWHASMIALHLVAVWLVFRLALELTGDRFAGAIAALLFGLMPSHADTISWGRSYPLPAGAIFQMAALLCFVRRARAPRRNLALALTWFVLALLSHEGPVVFPAIIAAYAFLLATPGDAEDAGAGSVRARLWLSVAAAAPFIAVDLGYLAARRWVLGVITGANPWNTWSLNERILTVPRALAEFLLVMALPWRAGPSHAIASVARLSPAGFYAPMLGMLAAGAGAWLLLHCHRHRRLYLFCAAWMLFALAPALNLRSLDPVGMNHDRYLYFCSAAWCIAVGDIAAGCIALGGVPVWIASAVTAALVLGYAGWLWRLEPDWRDNITYFTKCIEANPASWLCRSDLGMELAMRGDFAGAEREIEASIPLRPNDGIGPYNLAGVHIRMGKLDLAESELKDALKSMRQPVPDVYVELAEVAAALGDQATSEWALQRLAAVPEGPLPAALTRAKIRLHFRDPAGAEAALRALTADQRNNLDAWMTLAHADAAQGHQELALEDYTAAIRLEPNRASLHSLRALTLYKLGRRDEALTECQLALILDPGNLMAQALTKKLTATPGP